VTDQVVDGGRIVTYEVAGQLDMTLEADGGAQVQVSATF
jgi:hypothetical protein